MRGLERVGFNNLDILDEDDRVRKKEDDRQQMRRDQQCVSRGPGITGWRSRSALALTDGKHTCRNLFLRDGHGANGPISEGKDYLTALEK